MDNVVVTPWGQETDPADPDLPATLTIYQHYTAGHRYRISDEAGRRTVVCECQDAPIVVYGKQA